MTTREHAFALRILAGDGPLKAYDAAGYSQNSKPPVRSVRASELLKRPTIANFIAAERQKQTDKALLSRDEKRKILRDIAKAKNGKPTDKVRAIMVDNIMTGDNAPQQVNVFGLSDLLTLVRRKSVQ